MMRATKRKKLIKVLGALETLLMKCGGPGSGVPGPCPSGKTKPIGDDKEWKPTMSREEAEKWASDSKWKEPFYHGTSSHNEGGIKKEGFRVEKGVFGSGVYLTQDKKTADTYGKNRGDAIVLETRVRVKNPLSIDLRGSEAEWEAQPHYREWQKLAADGSPAARQRLIDAGYDGVQVKFGTTDYTVILDPKSIVVIE